MDVDEKIILSWLIKKYNVKVWVGIIRLRRGSSGRQYTQ
jgi:hypothetical protein